MGFGLVAQIDSLTDATITLQREIIGAETYDLSCKITDRLL